VGFVGPACTVGGIGAVGGVVDVVIVVVDVVVTVTAGWLGAGWAAAVVGSDGGAAYFGCDRGWKKDRIDAWARDVLPAGSIVKPDIEVVCV
jgi:hypothetical protein